VREQIGARFVTEACVKLCEESRAFHEVGLFADQFDHLRQEIAIGSHVKGRVVQADQVAVLRAPAEVRVGRLKPARCGAVFSGVD
jgi:hypothetical protein